MSTGETIALVVLIISMIGMAGAVVYTGMTLTNKLNAATARLEAGQGGMTRQIEKLEKDRGTQDASISALLVRVTKLEVINEMEEKK